MQYMVTFGHFLKKNSLKMQLPGASLFGFDAPGIALILELLNYEK